MSVQMRIEVEKKVIRAFVEAAIKDGCAITVKCCDESTEIKRSTDVDAIMAAIMAGDEDRLYVRKDDKPFGWVYCVYGNDGYDVISDYTTNLEYLMGEANKVSDHYAG